MSYNRQVWHYCHCSVPASRTSVKVRFGTKMLSPENHDRCRKNDINNHNIITPQKGRKQVSGMVSIPLACHRKCSIETSNKLVKVVFGIKVKSDRLESN